MMQILVDDLSIWNLELKDEKQGITLEAVSAK